MLSHLYDSLMIKPILPPIRFNEVNNAICLSFSFFLSLSLSISLFRQYLSLYFFLSLCLSLTLTLYTCIYVHISLCTSLPLTLCLYQYIYPSAIFHPLYYFLCIYIALTQCLSFFYRSMHGGQSSTQSSLAPSRLTSHGSAQPKGGSRFTIMKVFIMVNLDPSLKRCIFFYHNEGLV